METIDAIPLRAQISKHGPIIVSSKTQQIVTKREGKEVFF